MNFKVPVHKRGKQVIINNAPTTHAILPPVYSDREYEEDICLKKEEPEVKKAKSIPIKEKPHPKFKKKRPRIPRQNPSYGKIGVGAEDEKGFVSVRFS